jgi:hypothetical protein
MQIARLAALLLPGLGETDDNDHSGIRQQRPISFKGGFMEFHPSQLHGWLL